MDKLLEEIDKYLRQEMITIGIDIEHAKTGQMWAYDSERLSKQILSKVMSHFAVGEDELLGLQEIIHELHGGNFTPEVGRNIAKAQAVKSRAIREAKGK